MTIPERHPVKGWWFGGDVLPNGDGRKVTEGCVLRVEPPIVLCDNGLHFSPRLLDALQYAPDTTVWRVEGWGESASDATKRACEYRRHLWCLDISIVLRRFACREALRVLPDNATSCVRKYLVLADKASEDQRLAAESAACNAPWSESESEASDAARNAAEYAVRSAARNASWDAAWSAAWKAEVSSQNRRLESMVWAARRAALAALGEDGR